MSGTETKSRKRKPRNSFSAALEAACRRYAQATVERDIAIKTLDALDKEMPSLRDTIVALQKQLGKEVTVPEGSTATAAAVKEGEGNQSGQGVGNGQHEPIPAVPDLKTLPPEIAKHLVLDLSGMGSILPAKPARPDTIKTEDDTLPPIEGTPLAE